MSVVSCFSSKEKNLEVDSSVVQLLLHDKATLHSAEEWETTLCFHQKKCCWLVSYTRGHLLKDGASSNHPCLWTSEWCVQGPQGNTSLLNPSPVFCTQQILDSDVLYFQERSSDLLVILLYFSTMSQSFCLSGNLMNELIMTPHELVSSVVLCNFLAANVWRLWKLMFPKGLSKHSFLINSDITFFFYCLSKQLNCTTVETDCFAWL